MSTDDDATELEPQFNGEENEDISVSDAEAASNHDQQTAVATPGPSTNNGERDPGKSLLPFVRVQRIIKADKEIPIVAKEATFLISLATEEFIRRLTIEGQLAAHREKRSNIQHRDIATVVRRAEEFLFLEEVISWTSTDAPAKRPKPKAKNASGPIDQFIATAKNGDADADDIVMNEDGTMYAGNLVE